MCWSRAPAAALSEEVLREAVGAAGGRGMAAAEPVARRLALDEARDVSTRQIAMEALVWCGNDAFERALGELTRHADPAIAETAVWALDELRMFSSLADGLPRLDDLL